MCSTLSTVLGLLRPRIVASCSPVQLRIMNGRKLARVASPPISTNGLVMVWQYSRCVPAKPIPITNHNPACRYAVLFGYAYAYLSSSFALFCSRLRLCAFSCTIRSKGAADLSLPEQKQHQPSQFVAHLSPDTQPPSQFVA